jgi:hypothetical protein
VAEDCVVAAVEDYVVEAECSVAAPAWVAPTRISWVVAAEDFSFYLCRPAVAQIPAQAWPKAEAAMATLQSLS